MIPRFLLPNLPKPSIRYSIFRPNTRKTARLNCQSQAIGRARWNSSAAPSAKPDSSLSGKLKELSRKYGRAAIFVYLGISLIDFGIAFAAVHALGTERIGALEDKLFRLIKDWTGYKKTTVNQVQQASEGVVEDTASQAQAATGSGKASLWTEVVIAYGIHKALFIFIRIPITVAITPSIVKSLHRRGWNIGPATAKAFKRD